MEKLKLAKPIEDMHNVPQSLFTKPQSDQVNDPRSSRVDDDDSVVIIPQFNTPQDLSHDTRPLPRRGDRIRRPVIRYQAG